ncbi:lipocalin family protein [Flavobacterium sp. GSA192]|uniref:lipocalin family protein n=1 Tax=Flavobacterium sp. GSA192 TaxID=2576304 RepID=UPI001129B49A|nr:lipocalin family protein [Flavobacterium sp. GSA192]
MRKVTTLMVIVLVFVTALLFSCNDDDNPNPATASIEGKWNFNKISEEINGVKYPEENYDNSTGCPKDFVELKSGGIYVEGFYSEIDCDLDEYVGEWSKDGAIVTIVTEEGATSYEIVSITASTLKVKFSETIDGDKYVYRISFTKV